MPIRSAGLLIYRRKATRLEVLLVHPGGPYWAKKDDAAWSIPKGLVEPGEDELTAARRETLEELGIRVEGEFAVLGECRQTSGKVVVAWAIESDVEVEAIVSNTFEIEWPPRSVTRQAFPEVDRASWFPMIEAQRKILKGQLPFLLALSRLVA